MVKAQSPFTRAHRGVGAGQRARIAPWRFGPLMLLMAALGWGCSATLPGPGPQPASACAPPGPYVLAYFTGDGADGLHLAASDDGLRWEALNNGRAIFQPRVSRERLLRDPNLLRGPDGVFHLVWTAAGADPVAGYARSTNLRDWSRPRTLALMASEPGAKNVWAPKLFYDESKKNYVIAWASTVSGRFTESDASAEPGFNHRIYYTTTTDFEHLAPARLLYDPGFSVIDAAIIHEGSRYLMFVKDERRDPRRKHIVMASASSPEGPFGVPSDPITKGYAAEGPAPLQIRCRWYLYFEKFEEAKFGLLVSKDLVDWYDISTSLQAPPNARHGSVLRVPEEILAPLRAAQ
jgi:hypothetical protein